MQKERIFEKLKEIEENIALIEDHLPQSFDQFKTLGLVKDGIYKRLEHTIENTVDIFAMIYSSLSLGVPADDDDILERLQTKKIFEGKIISLVREMKGLRNILVHRYGVIDDEIVYDLLKNHLSDVEQIKSAIVQYFKKNKKNP